MLKKPAIQQLIAHKYPGTLRSIARHRVIVLRTERNAKKNMLINYFLS